MNWDAVGAMGEVFGAIAVFVTLGYLAVQVRHAREETRRSASQDRYDAIRQIFLLLATDARLLEADLRVRRAMGAPRQPFVNALMEQSGVAEEDATMLHLFNLSFFQVLIQMVQTIDHSTAGERFAIDGSVRMYLGMDPVGRLFYEKFKHATDPDMVRYIDNLLAQPA